MALKVPLSQAIIYYYYYYYYVQVAAAWDRDVLIFVPDKSDVTSALSSGEVITVISIIIVIINVKLTKSD